MYTVRFYEPLPKPLLRLIKYKREALYSRADDALTDLANIIAQLSDPRRCEYSLHSQGEMPLLVRCNVL